MYSLRRDYPVGARNGGLQRNILAGIVFGICCLGLIVLSIIPIGLGLIILIPVLMITSYTLYRDNFIGP